MNIKEHLNSFWKYVKVAHEGEDGHLSGKRVLGTLCIIAAIFLTGKASMECQDKLEAQAIIIAPLFATGLTFWGITSMSDYYRSKLNKTNQDDNSTNMSS